MQRYANIRGETMRRSRVRMLQDLLILACLLGMTLLWARQAWSAEIVDTGRLVEAIKKAENSYIHPYGIMRDYCKAGDPDGQCLKGCIQTVEKWKRKLDYRSAEEFIRKFGEIYAPTKGKTLRKAEREKNPNWAKNVLHFYNRKK